MAIQFTDFSKAPILKSPWENTLENALKGYQISQEPAKMRQEASARELANSLTKMEIEHKPKEYALGDEAKTFANALQSKALEHYEEKFKTDQDYKKAQIQRALQTNLGGTAKANGKLANFMVSHPYATQAQIQDFAETLSKAELDHLRQTTERGATLNETQYKRDASPLTKKHLELKDIDEGYYPGTKAKIAPDTQKKMRNDLLLSLVKDTTDPKIREKLINASNMNITLDSINPNYLTQYSGASNKANKIADSIIEAAGAGSPAYENYQHEVIKATTAAKQMRQYLGDSIQPLAQDRLDHLANPEAWNVSPQLAKENFEFIRDLFKRESQTVLRAAEDPTIYTAAGNSPQSSSKELVYNPATGRLE